MSVEIMQSFDVVEATFTPTKPGTLRPAAVPYIGKRGRFEALWIIEEGEGEYSGQWAMRVPEDWSGFVWVPFCDLSDIKPSDATDKPLERYA